MADIDAVLRWLVDRERIRAVIAQVARGEDRRDAALLRDAFWPDAATDYGIFAGDFAAYLDWVVPGAAAVEATQHVLGQSVIALDGDAARAETHVVAWHRLDAGNGPRDVALGGRYLDRLERRDGAWRIAARTMLYDWSQDVGPAADWSAGLMGQRFSAPHFAGRAQGDASTAFFAGGRLPAEDGLLVGDRG